jgi:hypothetical protein
MQIKASLRRMKDLIARIARPLSVVMLALSVSFTTYWFLYPPPPGKAVLWLGAAAVFMAVRGDMREMHGGEKVLWILVVSGLMFIELRAIDKDRSDHDREQARIRSQEAAARNEEHEAFNSIADGITTSIYNNQIAFDATMLRMSNLAKMSGENLAEVTGGDSFPHVDVNRFSGPDVSMHLLSTGKHPLYEIVVNIMDFDGIRTLADVQSHDLILPVIGRVNPKSPPPPLHTYPAKRETGETHRYRIMMWARNGGFHEILYVKRDASYWIVAKVVIANYSSGKRALVLEQIVPGFPKDIIARDAEWGAFKKLPRLKVAE